MTSHGTGRRQVKPAAVARKTGMAAAIGKQKPDSEVKDETKQEALYNPFFAYHKRRFPIWQRLLVLSVVCLLALAGGAMVGYGALGHKNVWDVFSPATWQHIFDFLKTE